MAACHSPLGCPPPPIQPCNLVAAAEHGTNMALSRSQWSAPTTWYQVMVHARCQALGGTCHSPSSWPPSPIQVCLLMAVVPEHGTKMVQSPSPSPPTAA